MPNDRNVLIEGAQIIFRNFSGKEGMYNRAGDRNFAILLPHDVADGMLADGWNIKTLKPREGDEENPPQPYIQVSVSYKGRPPKISLISSRGRTLISETEVELVDWVDIRSADVILNPYEWAVNGRTGVKAYLMTLYVIIEEDPLDMKYADVPLAIEGPRDRLAIESGESESDIIRVESERL